MQQLVTILHIFISVCVILLVLIQHGKGADMGAGFGSGASSTMFGSQGATPFLVKLTASLAILFFASSSVLSFIIGKQTARSQDLPFIAAPMKTVEPIPVSSEISANQSIKESAVGTSSPVATPETSKSEEKRSSNTVSNTSNSNTHKAN